MAKKKEDHTGFRNGDLFCFHCGDAQKIPLPMEMKLAADFFMLFAKHHKNCVKTWVEPSVKETEKLSTVEDKMNWWKEYGEHGTSAKTMFTVIGGFKNMMLPIHEYKHPHDPDDFRRCWLLLEAIPEFKDRIERMSTISDQWRILVTNWDKLTEMLIEGMKINNGEKMYDFMKSLGIE